MLTHIDFAIIAVFLIANLTLGVWVGRGITTIDGYAVGERNFSTATLAATIIATWVSGSFFTLRVMQTYKDGVWFLMPAICATAVLFIIAYVFAPRMKEFFGSISIAEVMGNLFGQHVRLITAIASIIQAICLTALQIKVFSTIFSHFFDIPSLDATCIASSVVIFYSTFGGIKSVTFTDVLQFMTFGVFIPLFLFFAYRTFYDPTTIQNSITTNPLLDFEQLINWQDPRFWPTLAFIIRVLVPTLDATIFQRILMSKDTKQIKDSFIVAGACYGAIVLLSCGVGLLMLAINPNLNPSNIVMNIVDQYSFDGLRGITIIGIMAMVMSTADSWINTGAVIFAHDFCSTVGIKLKKPLLVSRIFAIFIGVTALCCALFTEDLITLIFLPLNFYMPIVTVPLIFAILGFRSSTRAVLIGMFSGVLCVILWKLFLQTSTGVDSVFPAICSNGIALFAAHYLLGEPGGWVGVKGYTKTKSTRKWFDCCAFWNKCCNLNIINYTNQSLPQKVSMYVNVIIALILTTTLTTLFLDNTIYKQNFILITSLQTFILLISMNLLCNKLFFQDERAKYMGIIWYCSIFFGFAFVGSLLAFISKFSPLSVYVLIFDLMIIVSLIRWQIALAMISAGIYMAFASYQYYAGDTPNLLLESQDIQHNITYLALATVAVVIAFLKPKQDYQELLEEKGTYLETLVQYKDNELEKAIELKHEFLRNLEHEAHTPITGITSMGQVLWESYDLLSEKQRRQGLEDIAKSSERLASLVNNMIDLSKLSSFKYKLDKTPVNISSLMKNRLDICVKLYLKDKPLEFTENFEDNVIANCDSYYITRVIDNLIINAITYSKTGRITLSAKRLNNDIEFSISDEGIGIPLEEIYDIFGVFVVSSKTRSPAGGRGIGLALCKKSMEEHGGTITAESNGAIGATFRCRLPL